MKNDNGSDSVFRILDSSSLFSILIISVLISFMSLVIPIAAQTLINLVAFGKLLNPVITLSFMVFVLMAGTGALTLWQMVIIEIIQQKMMVIVSLNIAKHFTHLSPTILETHNGFELVNRYFELVVINKALASLLAYGMTLGLQVFFGLILLIFYHPYFLLFDAFILVSLVLIIFIPYRKAMDSAKKECSEKHRVALWIEQILLNRYLFKFENYPDFVLEQTDMHLVGFLKARKTHFKQLIKHQIGFYGLAAIATSLLLGLGGYLVINNQVSLGQLVASEIVLGSLITSFKSLGSMLENYYDLLASVEKIDVALSLPLDNQLDQDNSQKIVQHMENLHLKFTDMVLEFSANEVNRSSQVGEASPGNPILFVFRQEAACTHLVESLTAIELNQSASIYLNQIPCTYSVLLELRRYSLLVREPQWFSGTIYQNLMLNHDAIASEVIFSYLEAFKLLEKIMKFPADLHTVIHDWQTTFTHVELIELMLIRALIVKPKLLILDRCLDVLSSEEIEVALSLLRSLTNTTLVVTTLNEENHHLPNRLVLTL